MPDVTVADTDLHPDLLRDIEEYASGGPTPRARAARREVRRHEIISTLRRFRALDAIIEDASER